MLDPGQALVLTTGPRAAPGCRKHPGGVESYTLGGHSPEPEHDLVVAKVSVVIDGQDGLRLDLIPRQEAVVQAVLLRAYDLRDKHEHHGAQTEKVSPAPAHLRARQSLGCSVPPASS